MLETITKHGNAIANSEKRQKIDFFKVVANNNNGISSEDQSQIKKKKNKKRKENFQLGSSHISGSLEKESETDSEKELEEVEENKNLFLNRICRDKEGPKPRSETSASKTLAGGEEDSSPEDSTVKQTWSGSMSPGVFTSASDFSSSEYDDEDEEVERRKDGEEGGGGRSCRGGRKIDRSKRNSLTKDCNSDFRWVVSEKQSELTSPCDLAAGKGEKKSMTENFKNVFQDGQKNSESVLFYFMDRNRNKASDYGIDSSVQIRLPPQSPGSLDRKRLTKSRSERDQKCISSSVLGRSVQPKKKSHAISLGEEIDFEGGRKRDDWQHCPIGKEINQFCQLRKNVFPGCGCCGNYCSCHHHLLHPPPLPQIFQCRQQQQCRSNCGSCENLEENFGSRRTLNEERNSRKFFWPESQKMLNHGSEECLPSVHCCRTDDREISNSWKPLGKSGPELEERLIRLENDRESLQLQVFVLTEQVDAQNEKISDLQQILDDKKQQLTNTEDLLQREILARSSLETQKLELMSTISELKLQQAAMERENYELREEKRRYQNMVKPPTAPRNISPALLQSTPVGTSRISSSDYSNISRKSSNPISGQEFCHGDSFGSHQSDSFSDSHHKYSVSDNKTVDSVVGMDHRRQHQKEINTFSSSPQPNLRRSMDHYSSLPRQKILENRDLNQLCDTTTETTTASTATGRSNASGKGITPLITLKTEKSYSAPNLAETEKQQMGEEQSDTFDNAATSKPTEMIQSQQGTINRKGLKKLFNKIKRSNSGNVNDLLRDGDFKRGKIRATMGPRIGGISQASWRQPDKPLAEWDTESLCGWLEELSLENYVPDLRRWIKSGSQLLAASPSEIEKELGMKNHLHKKKLLLALQEMNEEESGSSWDELLKPAGRLDTAWVMRWLDDVGLPQHKEVFLTYRVDGRMLHRLTMDDLATMHITSALHIASLKKGIKVLREYKMDPNCLTRRSVPDEPPPTATDVALWTNHRVMEWLRIVDLAEYAPNLRGSGVHGALMVYENKFTADLLASLLNIPPNKTLLRRHLNTHFKELLGREVIQAKREAETTLGYIPLTPSAKVKTIKKPQFTLKRKKNKSEFDYGDLVCPLEDGASGENSFSSTCIVSANGGGGRGGTKEKRRVPDVCPVTDPSPRESPLASRVMRI